MRKWALMHHFFQQYISYICKLVFRFAFQLYSNQGGGMRKWVLIHHFFLPNNVFRIFSHVFVFIFVFYLYFSCSPTRGKEDEEALMHHFFLPNNVCRLAPQRTTLHEHSLCPQDHPLPIVHAYTSLSTSTGRTQSTLYINTHYAPLLIAPIHNLHVKKNTNPKIKTKTT